jgi:hypothetical protein
MANPSCARAALWYARNKGWLVLPLHVAREGRCSCDHPACPSPGKHPRTAHGVREASRDERLIAQWWRYWPEANVGIATGAASGLVVLDVDPAHGGDESLHLLELQLGALPATIEALSGGAGRHLYFAHPGGRVPNSASALGPGLDVRGDGGYVVAPPSAHASGRRYIWEVSGRPEEVALAPMPTWLAQAARPPERTLGRGEEAWLRLLQEGAEEGRRNTSCAALAGYLLRLRPFRPGLVAALVQLWNEARCRPPLSAEEVQRTVESVAGIELSKRWWKEHEHV